MMIGLSTLDLGIPGLPPEFPSLPSPPSFPFPGAPPLNQLGVWGSAVSYPSGVWGKAPADKRFDASEPKGAALLATVFVHFIRINLNFCTNTRLLSSRYSVSLRAKHSVGSRGKAPGQGVSQGTRST